MSMDVTLKPAAQIAALFQGPRHEIAVQLPEPENVTIVFTESVQQTLVLQEAPRVSVSLVAGVPTAPNEGVSGFTPADISAASDAYLFFGYEGEQWLIRRTDRGAGGKSIARPSANVAIANFTAAWAVRESLNYEAVL